MNAKTLKALKGSILKWQKIVDGTGEDLGTRNCPLCSLFSRCSEKDACKGCPVSEEVSDIHCCNTPYIDYQDRQSIANAKAELKFLQSLLPKKAGKKV